MPGGEAGSAGPMDRVTGILLFLPVPAVLFLFTRMPFGAVLSIGLGLALMLTHPLYARPWAVRRASRRCLWCGGPAHAFPRDNGRAVEMADPRGTVRWHVCREGHAVALAATLGWATRYGTLLRVGIGGTVAVSLVAALLAERGWLGPVRTTDASAFFRLGVALTVLPLGWIGARPRAPIAGPGGPLTAPFPMHVPALIGADAVLWLFRLVGIIWLAQGAFHFVERLS